MTDHIPGKDFYRRIVTLIKTMSLFRPTVFTKSENCPSEVPPTAGRRGTLSSEPPLSATLHEAIMDSVSSVRDSLPKEHHKHFETLRDEIIDFAQAHGIPKDALTKPQDLREAAQKLSTPDLRRLAVLLERFEHLLVKKEPWKNEEALEYAEEFYHLKKQYDSQVSLLKEVGILKDGAILGIDGKKYPIPTLEQIASRLFERRETLETKHDQGFTKLLLVPFGMSLDALQETLKQFLLSYKQNNPTFDLDTDKPFWIWGDYQGADMGESPNLVYHPKSFDENHQGKTKVQILKEQGNNQDSFPGWTIHLFQPSDPTDSHSSGFAPIPRQGQGTPQGDLTPRPPFRERGDRPPLEADQSPNEYLSLLQSSKDDPNSPYSQESGMTPEDWIMAFMTHFSETKKPLDDVWNPANTESYCYLTGAFFSSFVRVPCACWRRDCHRAYLRWNDPRSQDGDFGLRFSVVV